VDCEKLHSGAYRNHVTFAKPIAKTVAADGVHTIAS